MREANWKLLVNADGTGAELYNIAEDPLEKIEPGQNGINPRRENEICGRGMEKLTAVNKPSRRFREVVPRHGLEP